MRKKELYEWHYSKWNLLDFLNADPATLWRVFEAVGREAEIPEAELAGQIGKLIEDFRCVAEVYHTLASNGDCREAAQRLSDNMKQRMPYLARWPRLEVEEGQMIHLVWKPTEPDSGDLFDQFGLILFALIENLDGQTELKFTECLYCNDLTERERTSKKYCSQSCTQMAGDIRRAKEKVKA